MSATARSAVTSSGQVGTRVPVCLASVSLRRDGERHTSHNLKRVQRNLRRRVIGRPLYRGVQYSIHHGDFCVVEDQTCDGRSVIKPSVLIRRRASSAGSLLLVVFFFFHIRPLLTFRVAQQRRDAILIGLRLPQLHQRQEETLQRVVEGLQESEA